jgi:hypothetical protein
MTQVLDVYGDGEFEIPGKFEVCPRCEGKGSHVNPNIDGNGITSDEMAELGPQFLEDYLSGVYDVRCQECDGKRVVLVPDKSRCSKEQLDLWQEHINNESEYRANQAYWMRVHDTCPF